MANANTLRQSKSRAALQYDVRRVDDLGVVGLKSRVNLWLSSELSPQLVFMEFVVDSGASYTLIDLAVARGMGLPVPPPDVETNVSLMTARGATPMRVRPGRMRCWLHQNQRGYPFDWPVLFRVNAPNKMPSILGLGGVIHTCRWTFDGTPAPAAPYGSLALEDIR